MGRPRKVIDAQVFGRLTVVRPAGFIGRNAASLCRCSCGREKVIANHNLTKKNNPTTSCGCFSAEQASARVRKNPPRLKHGKRKTITYNCWQGMIDRCNNPRSQAYPLYGGRGIAVCVRWSDPDEGLVNFIEDMGERPSPAHSIDRIDGSRGYSPDNCRWATASQQSQNVGLKRSNTTGYKGVCREGRRWRAEIRNGGSRYHLGTYATVEEAALAYNLASDRLHGAYGVRNSLPHISKSVVKRVSVTVYSKINPCEE